MNQKPLQQEDPTGVGGESEALGQAGNPMESTAQEMRAWSGTSPWVLVVDDEPEILEEMADLFESSGYVCKTAGSGSAALEMLKEHP